MQNTIQLYRSLNEKVLKRIGFQEDHVSFFYTAEEGEEKEFFLAEEEDSKPDVFLVNDKEGIWDPNTHNLKVRQTVSIENPIFLFGNGGVAAMDSRLGIALSWQSRSSARRGIRPVLSFDADSISPINVDLGINFESNLLRGTVEIDTVIYLQRAGSGNAPGYATKPGTILGVLDSKTLHIDGEGSEFPIVEVEDPAMPLWWVECNWTDPMTEPFNQENIRIYLNLKHRFTKELNLKGGIGQSPLLLEILASSFQIIIERLKQGEDWTDIMTGQGFEKGSIGEAIFYFTNTFEWDTSSPEKLAKSIRADLYGRFGG
ncbi:hypothetical protein [Edaphobacillus lindanitolerans]|uniref:Uncharacterized protein n=1 Tax=Edaphobacillus lindanitolerans TaxID=550447 RepID=A0A1U7PNY2_9BACI|nr:hypothetical protein [Edaphobacillus lindanitolerans]SIT87329.1 hypothetical protein SAMN05428946_2068 [Edaphobacillus lindanitolerans]